MEQDPAPTSEGLVPGIVYLLASVATVVLSLIFLVATVRYWRRRMPGLVTMSTKELMQQQQSLARIVTPETYQTPNYWTSTDAFCHPPDSNSRGKVSGEAVDKVAIEDIDASAHFYSNRNLLRVKVNSLDLRCKGAETDSSGSTSNDNISSDSNNTINKNKKNNDNNSNNNNNNSKDCSRRNENNNIKNIDEDVFVYVIVSLEPNYPAIHESDMRHIADTWKEMVSEFDLHVDDIPCMTLHMSVHVCDRFSQHRHLKDFSYSMNYIDTVQSGQVKPVSLSRIPQ